MVTYNWVNVVALAAIVETVRVVIVAIVRRSPGAWIVGAGYAALVCTAGCDILLDILAFAPVAGVVNAYPYGGVCLLSRSPEVRRHPRFRRSPRQGTPGTA